MILSTAEFAGAFSSRTYAKSSSLMYVRVDWVVAVELTLLSE